MKRIILAVLGVLTVAAGVDAQNTAQTIERALGERHGARHSFEIVETSVELLRLGQHRDRRNTRRGVGEAPPDPHEDGRRSHRSPMIVRGHPRPAGESWREVPRVRRGPLSLA